MNRRHFLKLVGAAVITPTVAMSASKPAPWYLVLGDGQEIGPLAIIINTTDLPTSYHEKFEAVDADLRIDWIQIVGPRDNPLPPQTRVDGRVLLPGGRVGRITAY